MVFTDTVLEAGVPGAQRIDMLTWLTMKLQKLGDTFKYTTSVLEYEWQQSVGMDLLANLPRTPLSRLDLDLDVSPNDLRCLSEVCTVAGSSRGIFRGSIEQTTYCYHYYNYYYYYYYYYY